MVLIEGEAMKLIRYIFLVVFMAAFMFIKHSNVADEEDDLKKHIPNINLYKSDKKISEMIDVNARSESQVMGILFIDNIDDGLKIKDYYGKMLSEKGWKFARQEYALNSSKRHTGDRFYYEKGQYEFILVIYPFITSKATEFELEMLLGGKKPHYYIYIKKKTSKITAFNN